MRGTSLSTEKSFAGRPRVGKNRDGEYLCFLFCAKDSAQNKKTRCEEPLARVGVIRLTLRTQGRYTVFTMGEQPHCLVIIPHRRDFVNVQNRRFSPKIFVTNAGCRKIVIFGSTKLWKMPIFLLKNIFFGGAEKS